MCPQDPDADQIVKLIEDFKGEFQAKTKSAENFLTMSELENMWGNLESRTKVVYSNMIREMLANVNEKELVRKKKQNSPRKGSSCAPTEEPAKSS